MATRHFTVDWTNFFRANAARWLRPLRHRTLVYLEVGVFEGRSACWMLDNVLIQPASRYVGVDPWSDSWRERTAYRQARRNLHPFGSKVRLARGRAQDVLADWGFEPHIDIAYIDGDHREQAVVDISRLVWPRLGVGGILLWDDLPRNTGEVGRGVDRFLDEIANRYTVMFRNWQLAIGKTESADSAGAGK